MATFIDLEIKNYRCFCDSYPARFSIRPGFTALIGRNNSGKSTLLRFLYEFRGLFQTMQASDAVVNALKENGRSSFRLPAELPNSIPLFCDSNSRDLKITLRYGDASWQSDVIPNRLEITIPLHQNTFHLELYLPDGRKADSGHFRNDGTTLTVQGTAIRLDYLRTVCETLSNTLYVAAFRNAINVGTKENFYDIQVGQAFIKQWKILQTGDHKIQAETAYELTTNIAKIFGWNSLQINASSDEKTLRVLVDGKSYSLHEMGSGLAQFVVVLVSAAIKRPSYILIDEPELSLHASLQSDFLMTLASYCLHGTVFATHSLGLARSSADYVYSLTREGQGASRLQSYEQTPSLAEFVGSLSFGRTPELGFDRIVLVESQSDGRALQQLFRRLRKEHEILPLPLAGSSLINGEEGTRAQLLEILRITTRVHAVIDSERDSAGASLSADRAAFVALCDELKIDCHVLDRRALENYFSQEAIDKAVGAGHVALGSYERLKDSPNGWKKANNWRIAREMTLDDLKGTDLRSILDRV